MKRINYILLLAATMMASGCSDEVVSTADNQVLSFEVVAEQATRAEHVYCNSYLMPNFQLWARQDNGNPYIDNETCTRQGNTNSYTLPASRYVPKNDMYLEFYAVYNTQKATGDANSEGFHYTHTGAANGGNAKYIVFTPAPEAKDQKDLLYAASRYHSTADISSGVIGLNFRHLLSQVVFKAQVTNEHLHVEIDEIKFCNLKSTGKWTPARGLDQFTNRNLNGHDSPGANAPSYVSKEIGSWESSGAAQYTTGLLQETYDEKRSDPWELTKFVCESSDYIMHILERNTSNNPSIIRPFLGAIIEAKAQGLPIDTNIVGELAKYLNLLGGIYILDCLPEQRIHDKILAKANEICKVSDKVTA